MHVEGQNLEFLENLIAFWTAKSGGKSHCASDTVTSGMEVSPFVRFEKLVKMFRTRYSTSHALTYYPEFLPSPV